MKAIALLLLGAIGGSAPVSQTIDFSKRPEPVTVTGQGVEVTLVPMKSADGIDVSAAVRVPGYQSIIVQEGYGSFAAFERWVGIGKLSTADPVPSVILEGFTGGAHCCATTRAIVPVAGKLKLVTLPEIDGDSDKTFPTDVDGDGVADFMRQDDSFRYAFSSGAGSYSPPVVLNIYKGQIVDVSDQPGFRPIWEKFARTTRTACMDRSNEDRNGACAAYVAAGAKLGHFEAAMAEANKYANPKPSAGFPDSCSVDTKDTCPKGKEVKMFTFQTSLLAFLQRYGYVGQ